MWKFWTSYCKGGLGISVELWVWSCDPGQNGPSSCVQGRFPGNCGDCGSALELGGGCMIRIEFNSSQWEHFHIAAGRDLPEMHSWPGAELLMIHFYGLIQVLRHWHKTMGPGNPKPCKQTDFNRGSRLCKLMKALLPERLWRQLSSRQMSRQIRYMIVGLHTLVLKCKMHKCLQLLNLSIVLAVLQRLSKQTWSQLSPRENCLVSAMSRSFKQRPLISQIWKTCRLLTWNLSKLIQHVHGDCQSPRMQKLYKRRQRLMRNSVVQLTWRLCKLRQYLLDGCGCLQTQSLCRQSCSLILSIVLALLQRLSKQTWSQLSPRENCLVSAMSRSFKQRPLISQIWKTCRLLTWNLSKLIQHVHGDCQSPRMQKLYKRRQRLMRNSVVQLTWRLCKLRQYLLDGCGCLQTQSLCRQSCSLILSIVLALLQRLSKQTWSQLSPRENCLVSAMSRSFKQRPLISQIWKTCRLLTWNLSKLIQHVHGDCQSPRMQKLYKRRQRLMRNSVVQLTWRLCKLRQYLLDGCGCLQTQSLCRQSCSLILSIVLALLQRLSKQTWSQLSPRENCLVSAMSRSFKQRPLISQIWKTCRLLTWNLSKLIQHVHGDCQSPRMQKLYKRRQRLMRNSVVQLVWRPPNCFIFCTEIASFNRCKGWTRVGGGWYGTEFFNWCKGSANCYIFCTKIASLNRCKSCTSGGSGWYGTEFFNWCEGCANWFIFCTEVASLHGRQGCPNRGGRFGGMSINWQEACACAVCGAIWAASDGFGSCRPMPCWIGGGYSGRTGDPEGWTLVGKVHSPKMWINI